MESPTNPQSNEPSVPQQNMPVEAAVVPEAAAAAPAPNFNEALKTAWQQFKENWTRYVLSMIVFSAVFIVAILATGMLGVWLEVAMGDNFASRLILAVVQLILFMWIGVGMTAFYLAASARSEFNYALLVNAPNHSKAVVAQFVMQFIAYAGLVLLVVPGVVWAFRYIFVPLLVLERGIPIKQAMEESARMTYGYKWRLFFYSLGLAVIAIVGFLALVVGLLAAIPVAMLTWLVIYRTLLATAAARTDTPPVGHTNAIFIYGLVVGLPLMLLANTMGDPEEPGFQVEINAPGAPVDVDVETVPDENAVPNA